ncbi:MAG: TonB-dependent receptor, partial [Acidobacteria bacterium]|nr:TonB-dependent receptor [Acidobacteriota bacterium]
LFPVFGIAGFAGIGQNAFFDNISNTFQLNDSLSWIRGRHSIKTGVDIRKMQANLLGKSSPSANYSFNTLFTNLPGVAGTGFSLASFLLGMPNNVTLGDSIGTFGRRLSSYGVYFQDDFKVSARLTLNLGIRFQSERPETEAHNRQTNFDRQLIHPITGQAGAMFQASPGQPAFYDPDVRINPRLGVAYTITPKTVIRAGYGIFTSPLTEITFGLTTGTSAIRSFPTLDNLRPQLLLGQPIPRPVFNPNAVGQSVQAVNPGLEVPYVQHWNLSLQRELGANVMVEVAYVGSKGTHLLVPNRDLNQVPADKLGPPAQFGGLSAQQRRPFPQFNAIGLIDSYASSIYHSFQARVEKRLSGGLALHASYTFSKSIDDSSGNPVGFAGSTIQNMYNTGAERSVSTFDIPQRFVASFLYELPAGRGKAFLSNRG